MAIRVLPPEIAAKIAAGEVVERPASVAKELIENSLDSGAIRIDVEVRAGGVGLLRVVDNGSGMSAADAPIAFERYATSKLTSAEDLDSISTHGFRGEALPSIAAVSEVTVLTRPHDEMGGTYLRIVEGKVVEQAPKGAPPGTAISVKNLFLNVPARLKFLRSNAAEAGRIATLVTHYALAYPEVHFSLAVDGRTIFDSEGDGDLRHVAGHVYGVDAGAGLLPVAWESSESGVGIAVAGLVSPPSLSRSNRSYITLFVNRRLVQNRTLTFAIEDSYQGLLMVGRHPLAVLNLTIDPAETDVNVHPSKMEIKFRDEGLAFSAVRWAVQQALGQSGLARPAVGGLAVPEAVSSPPMPGDLFADESASAAIRPLTLGAQSSPRMQPLATAGSDRPPATHGAQAIYGGLPTTGASSSESTPKAAASGQAPLGDGRAGLPILRPLGQVGRTYIVAEGPDGMYLIDQHAAHERVLFDRFRRERAKGTPQVQGLLEPAKVELSHERWAILEGQMDTLRAYGFDIEPFGQRSVLIRALPAGLIPKGASRALLDLLDSMGEERLAGYSWDDRILTVMACHSAVRAGHDLALKEMEEIVRLLETTDNPRTCPHGRPTILHMSSFQLEREFGRR